MNEGDQVAHHADPRLLVEQPGAVLPELIQGGPDVVDAVGDVVHALASLFQKSADRGARPGGGDQLHVGAAEVEHGGVDAVLLHPLADAGADAEQLLVAGDAGVEVGYGDADMVDLLVGQASAFSIWSTCCSRCATRGILTRYSALTSPCSTLTVRSSSSGVASARNLRVR